MANYVMSRTGAEIEEILNHAANEWSLISDETLTAAEWHHQITDIDYSEIVIMVTGFAPDSSGENIILKVNGTNYIWVWHQPNATVSTYHINCHRCGSGSYIETIGSAGKSPLYHIAMHDETHTSIETIQLDSTVSQIPIGCKITVIGRK